MINNLRICATCRETYSYCPKCQKDKEKPSWYFSFCSKNCKNIYDVASKFENGQVSANKAKEILDKLDLSKIDNFGESYKASITKINSNAKSKVIKEKKVVVEDAVETIVETENEEKINTANTEVFDKEEKVIKKSKRATKNVDVE